MSEPRKPVGLTTRQCRSVQDNQDATQAGPDYGRCGAEALRTRSGEHVAALPATVAGGSRGVL